MNHDLMRRIGNAPGIPGFEDAAQAIVAEELKSCCDEVRRDHLGNIIAFKKATHPPRDGKTSIKLMLAAHVDEVGMLVTDITDQGHLKFRMTGGLSSEVAQSQRVIIHSDTPIRGIVQPKKGADGKTIPLADLVIDTGMSRDGFNF